MAARALSFLRPAVRSSGLQIRRCLSEHVHSSSKTTSFTPWLLGSATAMCVATGAAYYARQAFVDQESEYGVLTRAYAAPMPVSLKEGVLKPYKCLVNMKRKHLFLKQECRLFSAIRIVYQITPGLIADKQRHRLLLLKTGMHVASTHL